MIGTVHIYSSGGKKLGQISRPKEPSEISRGSVLSTKANSTGTLYLAANRYQVDYRNLTYLRRRLWKSLGQQSSQEIDRRSFFASSDSREDLQKPGLLFTYHRAWRIVSSKMMAKCGNHCNLIFQIPPHTGFVLKEI